MKKIGRAFGLGTIMLSGLVLMGGSGYAQDATINQKALNEIYQEELYAKEMYQQMVDKFDNDSYYERFIRSEDQHANSVKRVMERNDGTVEEAKPEVKVNANELKALKEAYQFEIEDVKYLEERIRNTQNEEEIRTYERLKERSMRHAESIKRAIADYEIGDTNLTDNRAFAQNGKKQGRHNQAMKGQMRQRKNGQNSERKNQNNQRENCDQSGMDRQKNRKSGTREGRGDRRDKNSCTLMNSKQGQK